LYWIVCRLNSKQESLNDVPRTQHELSTVPPTPDELPADTSIASNPTSPVVEAASNTADHLILPQDSSPPDDGSPEHVSDPVQLSIVTRSRSSEWSPDSIVLDSLQAQQQTDEVASIARTPSPRSQKTPLEKTPLSGPATLKTRKGQKRKRDDAKSMGNKEKGSLENEYRENNFVRLFNADHGRKSSMSEITDLDVILTAIEEEALEIRNEIKSSVGRQAIKEFFIQIRKSFSETIDIYRENHMLKSDVRKAKAKSNKLRKDLLSVQQKRSRISAKLEKKKNKLQENSDRQKALEEFSSFLVKLEALQKECRKDVSSKKTSKLDFGSVSNLPSLLIEGHGLLTAVNHLKSANDKLQLPETVTEI